MDHRINHRIILLVLIVAIAGGGLLTWGIIAYQDASKFMYIPAGHANGENAYDRGWKSVGQNTGALSFVYVSDTSALQLVTNDVEKSYAVRFDFDHSYYVLTRFSVSIASGTMNNLNIRVQVLQSGKAVATIQITDVGVSINHRIEVNSTRIDYTVNGMTLTYPIPFGGQDGLIFEITGLDGTLQFVGLSGFKLDD